MLWFSDDLRFFISNKYPGDADAAGSWTTLWEAEVDDIPCLRLQGISMQLESLCINPLHTNQVITPKEQPYNIFMM